jgi:hypothetical protein
MSDITASTSTSVASVAMNKVNEGNDEETLKPLTISEKITLVRNGVLGLQQALVNEWGLLSEDDIGEKEIDFEKAERTLQFYDSSADMLHLVMDGRVFHEIYSAAHSIVHRASNDEENIIKTITQKFIFGGEDNYLTPQEIKDVLGDIGTHTYLKLLKERFGVVLRSRLIRDDTGKRKISKVYVGIRLAEIKTGGEDDDDDDAACSAYIDKTFKFYKGRRGDLFITAKQMQEIMQMAGGFKPTVYSKLLKKRGAFCTSVSIPGVTRSTWAYCNISLL